MTTASPIKNIADTARWVAVYRAWETARKDAIFRDPLARVLAGEEWMVAATKMPGGKSNAWPMIVRTKVFDELILKAVNELGADAVVNLGAGLDSRPYRLDLPAGLVWVEADFPAMIEYKESKLAGETPRCRLERVSIDLSDVKARGEFLARIDARFKNVLVVTEGLIIYLTEQAVRELAADLKARAHVRWWLVDYASPMLLKMLEKRWGKMLKEGQSEFKFCTDDAPVFFAGLGWPMLEQKHPGLEAGRLKREMPYMWLFKMMGIFMSKAKKEKYRNISGFALLERKNK
jgi:methyltransferase (TIGR00027 family)